jgi:hypothetical protein
MKMNVIKYYKPIFFIIVLLAVSCSTDEKIDAIQVEGTEGTIETKLVGKWIGEIDGDLGKEDMTMTLVKDGSVSTTSAMGLYCTLSGTWEVVDKNFEAKGEDGCDGTIIIFSAPSSTTNLKGSWSQADGSSGTFSVNKE